MATHFNIDFYKKNPEILQPMNAGYVGKVLSPNIHTSIINDIETQSLDEKFLGLYAGESYSIDPGLYHVLCVGKPKDSKLSWFNYLFIVTEDGDSYPVAEYFNIHGSEWVGEAQKLITQYFKGKNIKPIKLTEIQRPKMTQVLVKK